MSYPDKATAQELADSNIKFDLSGHGLVIEFVDHTHCQVARIPYPNLLQWLGRDEQPGWEVRHADDGLVLGIFGSEGQASWAARFWPPGENGDHEVHPAEGRPWLNSD